MRSTVIRSPSAPAPVGPYSQGLVAGELVFLSGQIALDAASGQLVGADIEAQTQKVIANIQAVLAAAGLSLADVVKTCVFMVDLSEFGRMNEVYARHFGARPPARSTVGVAALPKGALVEIEVTALARRRPVPQAGSGRAALRARPPSVRTGRRVLRRKP